MACLIRSIVAEVHRTLFGSTRSMEKEAHAMEIPVSINHADVSADPLPLIPVASGSARAASGHAARSTTHHGDNQPWNAKLKGCQPVPFAWHQEQNDLSEMPCMQNETTFVSEATTDGKLGMQPMLHRQLAVGKEGTGRGNHNAAEVP
jgi:hypothetical protein